MSKLMDRSLLLPSQVNNCSFRCITKATCRQLGLDKKCPPFIVIANRHQESILRNKVLSGREITLICEREQISKCKCSDRP